MAAPRSMGLAVFPGSPPTHNSHKFFTTQRERKLPLISLVPKCQHKHVGTHAARPYKTMKVVKLKSTVDKQWRHTSKNCAAQTRPTLLAPVRKHHHGVSIPPANPKRDNKHRASQGHTIARLCNVTDTSATVEQKRAACFLPRRAYMNYCVHATTLIRHLSSNSEQLLPCR